jgi:fructose 1,6-bisphosphatase
MEKITVSLIKADVGGFLGHPTVHPELKAKVTEQMEKAKKEGLLVDYHVLNAGDDLQLIMSHRNSVNAEETHGLAWETFEEATEVAKELKLHGAGQDLLADAFSGDIFGYETRDSVDGIPRTGIKAISSIYDDKIEHCAFNTGKASILFVASAFLSYAAQNEILFILSVFSLALLLILYVLHLLVLIIKELRRVFDGVRELKQWIKK